MNDGQTINVLFLCTHNSARSIMAEALLNHVGRGRLKGFSAGSHPGTAPNPFALGALHRLQVPTEGLYSKSWEEFAKPSAPPIDFVLTVCDNAAGEMCPVWPGRPVSAHWGVEDPSLHQGSGEDKAREFLRVAHRLKLRIDLFAQLPFDKLDRMTIERNVREMGRQ